MRKAPQNSKERIILDSGMILMLFCGFVLGNISFFILDILNSFSRSLRKKKDVDVSTTKPQGEDAI